MTTTEILNEIQKLPLPEQRALANGLPQGAPAAGALPADERARRERAFERRLLAQGLISRLPARTLTDEEFDGFELLELEGEPLSEQVVRERI